MSDTAASVQDSPELAVEQSPYDQHVARLLAACQSVPQKNVYSFCVVDWRGQDGRIELQDVDKSRLSLAQVQRMRHILITPRRHALAAIMSGDPSLGVYPDYCGLFVIPVDRCVLTAFYSVEAFYKSRRTWTWKFDLSFAFTHSLFYDDWVFYQDYAMDSIAHALSMMWKAVLKHTDVQLGVDDDYTRPGVLALLEEMGLIENGYNPRADEIVFLYA